MTVSSAMQFDASAQVALYTQLGYPTFAIKQGLKTPATRNGLKDATADPNVSRPWVNHQNIGLLPPEQVLVLDADTGEEAEQLERDYPELRSAPRCNTPSGGAHFYTRLPNGAAAPKTTVKVQGRALDVRGLGKAYLVAPPSTIPKGAYLWARPLVSPNDLPETPSGLLTLLAPPKPPQVAERPSIGYGETAGNNARRYARRALQDEHGKVASAAAGSRNHILNRAAFSLGQLVGADALDRHEVEDALRGAAQTCGLDPRETETTISSGLEAGLKEPRVIPEPKGKDSGAANFTFGSAEASNRVASNSKTSVSDGTDLMQKGFALKKQNIASNSETSVSDGIDLMQSALHEIEIWGKTRHPPPPEWMVHHLLQDNAENLLAGEPGVGKSWIVADLAVSVASGTRFIDRNTRQGPVLIVNFDDAEALPRLWAERACKARGYTFDDLPLYYWQPDPNKPYPSSGILTPAVADFLKKEVARIKPRLIVIDAFSTSFPGKDGNKGQDVVEVFEALRQLRMAADGACILLVDHTPKQLLMESKRRGVSGSQQKHARTRSVHIVSKLEPSEAPGGGDVLEWRVYKINAAPYQEPFGITRHVDTLNGTASFEVRGLPEQERAPKSTAAAAAALLVIQSQKGKWIQRQALIEKVQEVTNAKERTVISAITAEVETHRSVVTAKQPIRGSPKQYRWHGEPEPEADLMQSDLMQNDDLMQSPLHQIDPVTDAKDGFDHLMQSSFENDEKHHADEELTDETPANGKKWVMEVDV